MKPKEPDGAGFGALLFVVALVPRVWAALALSGEPVWDGHYYDFGARRIAEGFGYSDDRILDGHVVWHPWCHYPVGYSAFLSVFYRALGASHSVCGVANALVGAALAVATWAVARHALSEPRARAAGLIVALHPGLVLYSALVMAEPLGALLTLVAFWLTVRDPRPTRGLAMGAAGLGVAALVRPQTLLCAPFLAGGAVRERWGRGRAVAAACALALLPVLPWTARNCRVMDGCALVSTNAGWNLAIGAFPRATGRFETLRSSDGCRDVTGQVQQDRCWLEYGLDQIRQRPWRWLALVPAKLGYTFDHESFAVEYLHEARPEAWPEERREGVRDATTFAHRLLLATAALGGIAFPLGRARRRVRTLERSESSDESPKRVRTLERGESSDESPKRVRTLERSESSDESLDGPAVQGAALAVAGCLGLLAFSGHGPVFWPLAVFAAVTPCLPLPGHPPLSHALLLVVALLGTTILTHAVFFGEDRYHLVVTPVFAILAAGALRRSA